VTNSAWNFGDGATSTLTHPTHNYTSGGVYTVSLTAEGPGGSDTLTETNYITVTSAVTAEFSGTPLSGTAPLTVTFTNLSSGASAYEWAFGDSVTSTATHPAHTYTQTGSFTVVLTATAGTESNSEVKVDYVTVNAASAGELVTTTITYTYDSLYRLTKADYSSGENFQYAYDAVGNMTAVTTTITSTVVSTREYDIANRLITVTTDGQVRTLEWSDAGELLRDGDDRYQWDAAGRLVSATVDGVSNRYAYLGDGGRISVTVGSETTTYTLDLAAPLAQVLVANQGEDSTVYLYGVARIGEVDGAWLYHLADHLGSVRSLVDADGGVDGIRAYRPYGLPLSSDGALYGIAGEWWESGIDLLYLRARYYAPNLRLFVSTDPWRGFASQPQTLNGYTYVLNGPVNFSDPRGLLCIFGFGNCDDEVDLFALPYHLLPDDLCLPWGLGCLGGGDYADWLEAYYSNLPAQNTVNSILPQLPRSRATDFFPLPCQEGDDWEAWKASHDLTSWLVNQMKVNSTGNVAQTIHDLLNSGPDGFVAANVVWYEMVAPGKPWDFKPDIFRERGIAIVLGNDWYGHDVPANIHFGYVGGAIGFDREWLHFWAGAAQVKARTHKLEWAYWYFDDPRDFEAIRVGLDLNEWYGSNITEHKLTAILEERKLLLRLAVAVMPPD